jgi:transcriptional regulator with XRE-family HTH domain
MATTKIYAQASDVSREKTLTKTQQAIIDLRASQQWTQADLAAYMERDRATIGRWESIRPPRGYSLIELSKVAYDFGLFHLREIFDEALEHDSELVRGEAVYPNVPLEAAVDRVYHWAHGQNRTALAYQTYRKLLRTIVQSHGALIQEMTKEKRPYTTEFRELQIEIEEMEDQEERVEDRKKRKEKRDAGK